MQSRLSSKSPMVIKSAVTTITSCALSKNHSRSSVLSVSPDDSWLIFSHSVRANYWSWRKSHVGCRYVVRFLPSWFPLAGFKRHAEIAKKKMDRVEEVPFEWAKENIVSLRSAFLQGYPYIYIPTFCNSLLEISATHLFQAICWKKMD